MAAINKMAGTVRATPTAVPLADEAEQQRVDDRRVPTWPLRIASLVIGYLWFTQVLWKLPWNSFGSPDLQPNPHPDATNPGAFIDTHGGLYHWMSVEAANGNKVLPFYGDLIKNLVLPNWQAVAWLTVLMETTITALLILGLLTRFAGFVSFFQALNLYLGLSQAPNEWYWSYGMLLTFGFIFMLTGAGRVWGLDARLRPSLRRQIAGGSGLARFLYRLT